MRQINIIQLQTRMETLDTIKNEVSNLIGNTVQELLKLMPSTEMGRRLLTYFGDSLLTLCENITKKNIATIQLKEIENDIIQLLVEYDIDINIESTQWKNNQLSLKNIVFTFVQKYCSIQSINVTTDNSEIPNDEKISNSEIPNVHKRKKGTLDLATANAIKQGNDGIERIEIAGTNAFVNVTDNCIQKKTRNGYITTHPWIPQILKYYAIPNAPLDMRQLYLIKVPNDKEQLCTLEEIDKGTAWSKFPHATGTKGNANKTLLGCIVETLASKIEITPGYITDGWQDDTGKKVYILEDGRGLDGKEYCIPTIANSIIERGKECLPSLPLEPITLKQANEMLEWIYKASPLGHAVICIAAQFRGYLINILPAYTSFFLYSQECDNTRDTSRIGKTMLQQAACNLSFPTRYNDSTHATFTGTPGSIEKLIAQKQSSNCVIDDLQISPLAGIKDVKEISNTLNMIVKTTADNKAARTRLQRNRQLAESNTFHVLACINGEIMPPVLSSLERRMIGVTIKPGDVDIDAYKENWDEKYVKILIRVGHMALRALEIARNEDDNKVRLSLQQYEKKIEKQLRIDVKEILLEPISQLCDDMPKVYSCLLAGIYTLGKYAFNDKVGNEWSKKLYPFVLTALIKQIYKMDGKKTADDKGSLTSLLQLISDVIASNGVINGQRYRIVGRKATVSKKDVDVSKLDREEVVSPTVYRKGGTTVEPAYFGSKANIKNSPLFAYVDINENSQYVIYFTEIGFQAILAYAKTLPEYEHFKTKQDIIHALKSEKLLARTGKDRNYVNVRLPGVSNKHHFEVLLSAYLNEELEVPEKNNISSLDKKRQEKENKEVSQEDKDIMSIADNDN